MSIPGPVRAKTADALSAVPVAVYRGVVPYVASNLVRLVLLLALPPLTLWLPAALK